MIPVISSHDIYWYTKCFTTWNIDGSQQTLQAGGAGADNKINHDTFPLCRTAVYFPTTDRTQNPISLLA